jgi:hypothetical protein
LSYEGRSPKRQSCPNLDFLSIWCGRSKDSKLTAYHTLPGGYTMPLVSFWICAMVDHYKYKAEGTRPLMRSLRTRSPS